MLKYCGILKQAAVGLFHIVIYFLFMISFEGIKSL